MFTVHEPLERKQPILELTETKPVGKLIIPDAVSTTVTLHTRLTPMMPVPGQATAVEVGVGETSIAVEEVAVCCGEPLSFMISLKRIIKDSGSPQQTATSSTAIDVSP